MKRYLSQLCLCIGLIATSAGCLTAGGSSVIKPETPIGNGSIGKDKNLPDKETSEIHLTIGEELEKNGYLADAADRYEKARQLDPKLKHLSRRLALLHDKMGNERRALEEYDEALTQNPKDADLINDLGYCHYNRGRWTDAETCFRNAVSLNPKHKRANVNLGLALAQQDKLEESLEAFMRVTRPAEAKANVAFVLAAHGKKAEAKSLYQEALKVEPGLLVAQNGMAALDAPKKAEMPDSPIQTANSRCVNGECTPVSASPPVMDMSPITIDPRSPGGIRVENK